MGWKKLQKCPVGGAQSRFTGENSVTGLVSPHYLVPHSTPPTPPPRPPTPQARHGRPGTHRGRAGPRGHSSPSRRATEAVPLPSALSVAGRGAGEWKHTVRKNFKFKILGAECAHPHAHQLMAWPGAGSRGPQDSKADCHPGGSPEHGSLYYKTWLEVLLIIE